MNGGDKPRRDEDRATEVMRLLLIAYEFPPSPSPRSLRWAYLVRELALRGHEVHVLAPRLAGSIEGMPRWPETVRVHRTFPGPVIGLMVTLASRAQPQDDAAAHHAPRQVEASARLNWKGRLMDAIKRTAGLALFPDVRAEWNPWARRALDRLLRSVAPDVVLTSHEPASTLPLGRRAKQRGYRWVADLGDPVCAPYTPRRWRRRALALERLVCTEADHVLVTNLGALQLLQDRHRIETSRCSVLPQGFDDRREAPHDRGDFFVDDRLELFYAGRLYAFRRPDALFEALRRTPRVRATLVIADPPRDLRLQAPPELAGRLRVLDPLPHARVLDLQSRADVLLSFGNRDLPAQIPGKLYEYFGAARPILHLLGGPDDPVAQTLRSLQRGWSCPDRAEDIAVQLAALERRKQAGTLDLGLQLTPATVTDYAASRLGVRLDELLLRVAGIPPAAARSALSLGR